MLRSSAPSIRSVGRNGASTHRLSDQAAVPASIPITSESAPTPISASPIERTPRTTARITWGITRRRNAIPRSNRPSWMLPRPVSSGLRAAIRNISTCPDMSKTAATAGASRTPSTVRPPASSRLAVNALWTRAVIPCSCS